VGHEVDEEGGVLVCPGEEEDLDGGLFGFSGADAGDEGFHIVGYDAENAVLAFTGGVEHFYCAVGGELLEGHSCGGGGGEIGTVILMLGQSKYRRSTRMEGPGQ